MTLTDAIAIAESIRKGERRIDEIALNQAERLLKDAGDSRVSDVHWLKVRQDRIGEWCADCL